MRKPDVDATRLREFVAHSLGSREWRIARVEEGVSTQVYRLTRERLVLYLRLGEDAAASLAPEAFVLEVLAAKGVRVPEVVAFEAFSEVLERSVLVTSEIRGAHAGTCSSSAEYARVLRAAGRDLAVVNGVAVDGFGWVRRDRPHVDRLEGEHATHAAFALEELETRLRIVEPFVGEELVRRVRDAVGGADASLHPAEARLAHGDFDVTAIFHDRGRYTGVIDFGEIRGAHPLYDLAHFQVHDCEPLPWPGLAHLLGGYDEVAPLPHDHMRTIGLLGLLIGVRTLARTVGRRTPGQQAFLVESLRRSLNAAGAG